MFLGANTVNKLPIFRVLTQGASSYFAKGQLVAVVECLDDMPYCIPVTPTEENGIYTWESSFPEAHLVCEAVKAEHLKRADEMLDCECIIFPESLDVSGWYDV